MVDSETNPDSLKEIDFDDLITNILGSLGINYSTTTFTPVIEGTTAAGAGTYTTQLGTYTRMFNVVMFKIALVWTAHTGTGNFRIAGLPVTAANDGNSPSLSVYHSSITLSAAGNKLLAFVVANTTTIVLQEVADAAASSLTLDTAGTLRLSGIYWI